MFIIVEYTGNYTDIMLAMNEQFDIATFKTRAEAEVFAKEECGFVNYKVVEI